MKFIADVINQLEERGEQKKSECLRKHTNLQKQYEAAQRYSREMTAYDNDETPPLPLSDINIEIHDTETALQNYRETHPTQGNAQLPMQQATYSKPSKSKTIKQLSKERRKELMEKHYELLDWIQCIDDGIVKGCPTEARRMVNKFNDYADRLDALIKEKYVNRAENLLAQFLKSQPRCRKKRLKKLRDVLKCVFRNMPCKGVCPNWPTPFPSYPKAFFSLLNASERVLPQQAEPKSPLALISSAAMYQ